MKTASQLLKRIRWPWGARLSIRHRWLLVWLGLLLLTAVWAIRRWQQSVPLGPQRTVYSTNAKIGIHTRLTDEVEPWKIKRSLEMVREMGAGWIVEYFPWAYYEPRPGQFDWSHADLVMEHANRQGLHVIARLGYTPEWARPPESTPLYLDQDHFADFGRYAARFAGRYRGQVDSIVLWNEPNLSLEWGYRPVDPGEYVAMLRIVTPMVRAANPQVRILAGALAPTLAAVGSEWGMNDLLYLQGMYEAGAAPFFDSLAMHAYGWHFSPDEPAAADVVNFRRAELLRQIMVDNGDGHKTAMITEGGWNDHPRWTRAVRPAQRIHYTIQAYTIAQNEWPWLENISLWVFRFPWDSKSYQDYYTFVGTDFGPKPIYDEVRRYAQGEAP